jgi:hypothetical protein
MSTQVLRALIQEIRDLRGRVAALEGSEYIANAGRLQSLAPDATGAANAHVVATDASGNVLLQSIIQSTAISARVYRATDQTIATATPTVISFSNARWDDRAGLTAQWAIGDPTKLVCRVAGVYAISAHIEFGWVAAGERRVEVLLNGATVIASARENAPADVRFRSPVGTEYKLAVDDYVQARVYQNTGADLPVTATLNHSPELVMTRIP